MKRISLNIDLEDNEVLEEEIKKVILASSKQISREVIEKEISSEIERVIDVKVKDLLNPVSHNALMDAITDRLAKKISQELSIKTNDFVELANKKMEAMIEQFLEKKFAFEINMDEHIEYFLKRSIKSILSE